MTFEVRGQKLHPQLVVSASIFPGAEAWSLVTPAHNGHGPPFSDQPSPHSARPLSIPCCFSLHPISTCIWEVDLRPALSLRFAANLSVSAYCTSGKPNLVIPACCCTTSRLFHLAQLKLYSIHQLPFILSPSACILLSDSLTPVGPSHRWNHTVFVSLGLAHFTNHMVFKVHPCCSTLQN